MKRLIGYGEIAPIESFHKIRSIDVYNDIINTVRNNKKPKTVLVKTVLDIWQALHKKESFTSTAYWTPIATLHPLHNKRSY